MGNKGFVQFGIIINVLVRSFRFIWIHMLWSTATINILILLVRGSSLDVRCWRLKTVPALKGLTSPDWGGPQTQNVHTYDRHGKHPQAWQTPPENANMTVRNDKRSWLFVTADVSLNGCSPFWWPPGYYRPAPHQRTPPSDPPSSTPA